MKFNDIKIRESVSSGMAQFFSLDTVRNVMLVSGGIMVFVAGVIVYGVILNLREKSLSEMMNRAGIEAINNPSIIIDRKSYVLELYEDSLFIKSYRVGFGRNVNKEKSRDGDYATPVGQYEICEIISEHDYHIFFKINYPNVSDISDGLRRGIISQKEFDQLRDELLYGVCPQLHTKLGANIGIHGIGRLNAIFKNLPFVYNWTDGSIALSNENIDELLSVIKKGTKVVIK